MADVLTIQTESGALPVLQSLPPAGTGPGLVVGHGIFGLSPYVRRRCDDLAAAGYVVYAPELYWRLREPLQLNERSEEYVQQGMAAAQRLDWEHAVEDVCDAVAALRGAAELSGRVGLLGYGLGGGLAFAAATRCRPDALVSYYGSALPSLTALAGQVTCPQLHVWGDADTQVDTPTQELVRRTLETASRGPVVWRTFAGAGHAFDNPHPWFHHAPASDQAWEAVLDFLATYLD